MVWVLVVIWRTLLNNSPMISKSIGYKITVSFAKSKAYLEKVDRNIVKHIVLAKLTEGRLEIPLRILVADT